MLNRRGFFNIQSVPPRQSEIRKHEISLMWRYVAQCVFLIPLTVFGAYGFTVAMKDHVIPLADPQSAYFIIPVFLIVLVSLAVAVGLVALITSLLFGSLSGLDKLGKLAPATLNDLALLTATYERDDPPWYLDELAKQDRLMTRAEVEMLLKDEERKRSAMTAEERSKEYNRLYVRLVAGGR